MRGRGVESDYLQRKELAKNRSRRRLRAFVAPPFSGRIFCWLLFELLLVWLFQREQLAVVYKFLFFPLLFFGTCHQNLSWSRRKFAKIFETSEFVANFARLLIFFVLLHNLQFARCGSGSWDFPTVIKFDGWWWIKFCFLSGTLFRCLSFW